VQRTSSNGWPCTRLVTPTSGWPKLIARCRSTWHWGLDGACSAATEPPDVRNPVHHQGVSDWAGPGGAGTDPPVSTSMPMWRGERSTSSVARARGHGATWNGGLASCQSRPMRLRERRTCEGWGIGKWRGGVGERRTPVGLDRRHDAGAARSWPARQTWAGWHGRGGPAVASMCSIGNASSDSSCLTAPNVQ
jgi:hypothetical protein